MSTQHSMLYVKLIRPRPLSFACLAVLGVATLCNVGWAQGTGTYYDVIPAGSGNLSYTVNVYLVNLTCVYGDNGESKNFRYWTFFYSNFVYTVNGTSDSLSGTAFGLWDNVGQYWQQRCGLPPTQYPQATLTSSTHQVKFTPCNSESGQTAGCSASVIY